jgi:hypothetical protein
MNLRRRLFLLLLLLLLIIIVIIIIICVLGERICHVSSLSRCSSAEVS